MQVNLMGTGMAAGLSGTARVLSPDLLPLLESGSTPRNKHERTLEQREEKLRDQDTQNDEAVAAAAAEPRPVDQMRQAERDMASGSTAARRAQMHAQAEQSAAQDHAGFRQVLAEATSRSSAEPAAVSTAEPLKPADPQTATEQPDSGDAGKADQSPKTTTTQTEANSAVTRSTPAGIQTGLESWTRLAASVAPQPAGELQQSALDTSKLGAALTKVSDPAGVTATTTALSSSSSDRTAGGPVAAVEAAPSTAGDRKTTPDSAAQAEADPTGNSDANVERILRFVRTRIGKGHSVATLRLDPPELGTVRLRMELRDSDLSLSIDTQSDAARRLLTEHLDALRRNLEASGIHLDRVDISVPTATNDTHDAGLPQYSDVPPRDFGNSARRDPESAGGGQQQESDAHTASSAEIGQIGADAMEPAAESLVNVLA